MNHEENRPRGTFLSEVIIIWRMLVTHVMWSKECIICISVSGFLYKNMSESASECTVYNSVLV